MNYLDVVSKWKNQTDLDIELLNEINNMNDEELKEAFYTDLEFGTGGMRGILGAGTNRMNIYTVARAALGFGRYLKTQENALKRGVVISHDNRLKSRDFAVISAKVLMNLGFTVYMFSDLRPTPLLSYSVRYKNAIGGIMITASHNPKEYNGFKIYDQDGCQLVPNLADLVINEIAKIDNIFDINMDGDINNIVIIDEVTHIYKEDAKTITFNNNLKKDFKIVYTPLHGTGATVVPQTLKELGYDVYPYMPQMIADPMFSNVQTSNPENKEAYKEAIMYANEIGANVVLATDPDADRLGVAVRHDKEFVLLTGNQSAALIFDYILLNHQNEDLSNSYLFTTVVSSTLPTIMAKNHNMKVEETLTGFKFIGEKAKQIEGKGKYLFGFEESYGCLIKDSVRDKDSIQACIMLSEACAYYYEHGYDLYDALIKIYEKYGYFMEGISNISLSGIKGKERINQIMEYFRNNEITIPGYEILIKEDMKKMIIEDYVTKKTTTHHLPNSNVIKYHLNNDTWFVLRPSGTEPKLKVYYGVKGTSINNSLEVLQFLEKYVLSLIETI